MQGPTKEDKQNSKLLPRLSAATHLYHRHLCQETGLQRARACFELPDCLCSLLTYDISSSSPATPVIAFVRAATYDETVWREPRLCV
jgi:hypothetical protein